MMRTHRVEEITAIVREGNAWRVVTRTYRSSFAHPTLRSSECERNEGLHSSVMRMLLRLFGSCFSCEDQGQNCQSVTSGFHEGTHAMGRTKVGCIIAWGHPSPSVLV